MANRNKHIVRTEAAALALTAILSGTNALPVFAQESVTDKGHTVEKKSDAVNDIKTAEKNWDEKQKVLAEKQTAYKKAVKDQANAKAALEEAKKAVGNAKTNVSNVQSEITKQNTAIADTKKNITENNTELGKTAQATKDAMSALEDVKTANPIGAEEELNKRMMESQSANEALKKAETDLTKAQAEEDTAKEVLTSYQTALEKATNDKESAIKAQSKAEEELASAKANQATADKALADAIDLRDNKTTQEQTESYQAWQKAKAETEKAQSAYDEAEKAVEKAKADYDATTKAMETVKADPTTVTDTDPALTEAETKAKTALEALNTAKATEAEKQTAYESANQVVTDAKSAVTKAQTEKDTADKAVTDAETALENAKKDVTVITDSVNRAQENVTNAEKALSNANGKIATAQTEYETAETTVQKAQTAVANAQTELDKANAKVKAAEAVIAQGSLGFFSSRMNDASLSDSEKEDAKLACDIITYSTTKESTQSQHEVKAGVEEGITYLGRDDDATSLENMKKAIDLIGKGNRIITKDDNFPNLAPFNVADSTMAYAQASANMETYTHGHWIPTSGKYEEENPSAMGENAAWGYSNDIMDNESDSGLFTQHDPYYGWYYQEKEFYEFIQNYKKDHPTATNDDINTAAKEAVTNGQFQYANHINPETFDINDHNRTGHYLNLTTNSNVDTKSTGLAVNERNKWTTQVQDFNYAIPGVSYDTYKASFDTYYNKVHADLDSATKEVESANTALTKAQTELTNANAILSAKQNALDQVKADNNVASLTTAVETAKANLTKAERAETNAEQNVTALTTALSDKQTTAGEKATAFVSAQNVLAEKETALTHAMTAWNTAKADTKAKQTAYDTAVQTVKAKADAVTANAKALYDHKAADQSKASTVLSNAKQAESNAKATFDDVVSGKAIPSLQAKATKAKDLVNEKTKAKTDADAAVAKTSADIRTAVNAITKAQADVEQATKTVSDATKAKANAKSIALAKANAYQESVKAKQAISDAEEKVQTAKQKESDALSRKAMLTKSLTDLNQELDQLTALLAKEQETVTNATSDLTEKEETTAEKDSLVQNAKAEQDQAWKDTLPDTTLLNSLLTVTDGANTTFDKAEPTDMTFRANGSLPYFDYLTVDGAYVNEENYDLKEGSTIATLHKDFLNGLKAGRHKLTFVYTYGEEDTTFTVKDAPVVTATANVATVTNTNQRRVENKAKTGTSPKSPKTGEPTSAPVGLLTALLSGLAVFGIEKKKKKI